MKFPRSPSISLDPWLLVGTGGAVGYLAGIHTGNEPLMQFSRILPHLLLFQRAWEFSPPVKDPVRFRILLALAACTAGDYILRKPQGFMAGVFGFLIAQLALITAFMPMGPQTSRAGKVRSLPLFLTYAAVLLLLLREHLGEFRIPVLVYALTIAVMGWRAWITRILPARIGALLFLASDTMLAFEKFHPYFRDFPVLRFPVIFTYWGALAFLIQPAVRSSSPATGDPGLRLVTET